MQECQVGFCNVCDKGSLHNMFVDAIAKIRFYLITKTGYDLSLSFTLKIHVTSSDWLTAHSADSNPGSFLECILT